MKYITWKTGIFSNKYEFFEGDKPIGKVTKNLFSSTSEGTFNNKFFSFKVKGIFKGHIEIYDENHHKIAAIEFNFLHTKAEIKLANATVYQWKYENILQTKWSITKNNLPLIDYQGEMTSGSALIHSTDYNELIFLAGLSAHDYLTKVILTILIAVIIPILT
jgi:hypothetical protein